MDGGASGTTGTGRPGGRWRHLDRLEEYFAVLLLALLWVLLSAQVILRFGFGGPGGLPRYAVRDFELRGKKIRKGQMMLLSFGGASRDPAVYDDPDRFDVTRDVRDLITFGNGPHYCLGANLARQEMGAMLDMTVETASRIVSALRRDGILEPHGAREARIDMPRLLAELNALDQG